MYAEQDTSNLIARTSRKHVSRKQQKWEGKAIFISLAAAAASEHSLIFHAK